MKISYTRGTSLLDEKLAKLRSQKAQELISNVGSRNNILDIGCGSYPLFLTQIDFKNKFGVDPVLTTSSVEGVKLSKINVEKQKLPYKNNFFDVETMLAVYEHVNKDKLDFVLSEAFRVLNQGGLLIITTPSPWSDKLLHQMARFKLISEEEIHEHKHNQNSKTIKDTLVDAGFKKDKVNGGYFELGFNMWFVAQK